MSEYTDEIGEQAEVTPPAGPHGRKGFALVVAMLAIVVIGAIMVGGQAAASNETLVSESEQYAGLALFAAERGMAQALGTVSRMVYEAIPIDSTEVVIDSTIDNSNFTVSVRRLAGNLYMFTSTGSITRGSRMGSQRTIAAIGRTRSLKGDFNQAMLVFAGAQLKGSVLVSGTDQEPTDWEDCIPTSNKPGIVAKDTGEVKTQGSATITGNPAVEEDTTISMANFTIFGSMTYDELAEYATKVYDGDTDLTGVEPDTTIGGDCDKTVKDNWGEPVDTDHPCHFYFPLIHVKGDLELGGNSYGQGILLIDGDLDLSGTAAFYGIVVVMGSTNIGSGTAQVKGTLLTANEGEMSNPNELSGTPTIQYSSCAVERAQTLNDLFALAFPIAGRAWMDVTAAQGEY